VPAELEENACVFIVEHFDIALSLRRIPVRWVLHSHAQAHGTRCCST